MIREELIEKIVKDEWTAFDKVKNEGGRADCQDNWNTFSIMRKSQFMAWSQELLESYSKDLDDAKNAGINLIEQKYGFMMESTAPDRYREIEDGLIYCSQQKKKIIEEIVKIQVSWVEEFAKEYPKLAGNARSIHTYQDSEWNTSSETYLRGELMTYSDETVKIYGEFVLELLKENKNLNRMIMENTVHLYGYESLETAEGAM